MEGKYWLVLSAEGSESGVETRGLFLLDDFGGAVLERVGKWSDEHGMEAWLAFRAAVRDLRPRQFKTGRRTGHMYHTDTIFSCSTAELDFINQWRVMTFILYKVMLLIMLSGTPYCPTEQLDFQLYCWITSWFDGPEFSAGSCSNQDVDWKMFRGHKYWNY